MSNRVIIKLSQNLNGEQLQISKLA